MRGQEPRVELPALEVYSDLPLFNTKAVVHQTGVPAPTLRAWERRYGVLTPRRGENDYRLYSERDIITVAWLRERVQTGMTISQAIALLKSLETGRRRARRAGRGAQPEPHGNGHGDLYGTGTARAVVPTLSRLALEEAQVTLLHQFANLDEHGARHTIAQMLAVYPVEDVCLQLLTPAMVEVGRRWAEGELSVTAEHFASGLVRALLETLFRTASAPAGGPLLLVGCAPGELHELGPLMLALFLRRAGLRVAYLGQTVEPESLIETVRSLHPAGVLLSASLRAHVEGMISLARRGAELMDPRPLVAFGGQAFAGDADLAAKVPGLYLGNDPLEAVRDVRKRLIA